MPTYEVMVELNIRYTTTVEATDPTAARYAAIQKAKQALEAVPGTSSLSCSDWEVSETQPTTTVP